MTETIHILLVEDDPGDVFLIREALKSTSLPCSIDVADNGERALDYLHRRNSFAVAERPDLILLDLNLPRINGIEVLNDIKSVPRLSRIPVIVLTTSKNEADAGRCRELGADVFLSKPPSFEEFLNVGLAIERFWNSMTRKEGVQAWQG